MDNILTNTQQADWWISVVFVGVVINLFSNWLSSIIHKKYSHLMISWAERNEKLKDARDQRINDLAGSDRNLFLAHINLSNMKLDCIYEFLLALVLADFGLDSKNSSPAFYSLVMICAIFALLRGLLSTVKCGQESLVLTEARVLAGNIKK